jgi:hypothetical protein
LRNRKLFERDADNNIEGATMVSKGHGMKSGIFAAALLSGLAFATAANATPIMYQFSATNGLGFSATGSFTFNTATNRESAISITISGSDFPGLNGVYTQAGPIAPPPTTPLGDIAEDIIVGLSGASEAWVGFAAPLGPSGGAIFVFGASSPSLGSEDVTGAIGSAVAVVGAPEPASFAVLGVGILGLVATKRHRKLAATLPASPA